MPWIGRAKVKTMQEKVAEAEAIAATNQRRADIDVAKEAAGLKDIDITSAEAWIDSQIDQATTVATLKEQVKKVLKKMVPYILN